MTNALLDDIYANRIIDLETTLRQIDRERQLISQSPVYKVNKERMLAFRYHLKWKELCKARQYLNMPEPRKEPTWVEKYTKGSIIQYIAYGE